MPKPPSKRSTTKPDGRSKRISKPIRTAVEAMVWEGLSRREAAKRAGCSEHGLYQALRRPHVLQVLKAEHVKLRQAAPFKAYSNIVQLAEEAESEHVRLSSNQWIAGVDALAPVARHQIQADVRHTFSNYSYELPIDVTPDYATDESGD